MAETKLPPEILNQLQNFHKTITGVEEALEPHLDRDPGKLQTTLDCLDQARLQLMSVYSANALLWIYLCTKGRQPAELEGLKAELDRIRDYMTRLKSIEDKAKMPKLNRFATKAFVRNALWEPKAAEETPQPSQLPERQPPEQPEPPEEEAQISDVVEPEGEPLKKKKKAEGQSKPQKEKRKSKTRKKTK